MRLFGLIGYPLTHSLSASYFEGKFAKQGITDAEYRLFEISDLEGLDILIGEHPGLCGLNVTIPHKRQVMERLDEVDPVAGAIGAVNCIRIQRKGSSVRTTGFNTDAPGFQQSVGPLLEEHHQKALILGTGGSARAVAYALEHLGVSSLFISRDPRGPQQRAYGAVDEDLLRTHHLIVNASPAGMYPRTEECPDIPYHLLTGKHLLFDLVYNPAETLFMASGREAGARAVNGLEMLHLQADLAWTIWNE